MKDVVWIKDALRMKRGVRISRRIATIALGALATLALAAAPRSARAQSDEALMPDQSAAKAKALLQEEIAALGGHAYLSVHDYVCEGRLAQFAHSG
jgi:NAD/NADP transhydrogenase alpha subunit